MYVALNTALVATSESAVEKQFVLLKTRFHNVISTLPLDVLQCIACKAKFKGSTQE
jgi:hypothetical protein